ncbi:MAG: hypothetical protein ACRDCB_04240 [Clostridium sp.]
MNSYKKTRVKVELIKLFPSLIYLLVLILSILFFEDKKIELSKVNEYVGIGLISLFSIFTIVQREPMIKIDVFEFSNKLVSDKEFKVKVFIKVTCYLIMFYYGISNIFIYTKFFSMIFKTFIIMVSFRGIKVMKFSSFDYVILGFVIILNVFDINLIIIWIGIGVFYFSKGYSLDSTSMYIMSLTIKDIKENFNSKNNASNNEIYYKNESRGFIKKLDYVKNIKTYTIFKLNTLILKIAISIGIIVIFNIFLSIMSFYESIIISNTFIILCIVRYFVDILNYEDSKIYKNKIYPIKICKGIIRNNYFIIFTFINILIIISYIFIGKLELITLSKLVIYINLFTLYFQNNIYNRIIDKKIFRVIFENLIVFLPMIFI